MTDVSDLDGSPLADLLGRVSSCTGLLGGCAWVAVAPYDSSAAAMVATSIWLTVRGGFGAGRPGPAITASIVSLAAVACVHVSPVSADASAVRDTPFAPVVYLWILILLLATDVSRVATKLAWPSEHPEQPCS